MQWRKHTQRRQDRCERIAVVHTCKSLWTCKRISLFHSPCCPCKKSIIYANRSTVSKSVERLIECRRRGLLVHRYGESCCWQVLECCCNVCIRLQLQQHLWFPVEILILSFCCKKLWDTNCPVDTARALSRHSLPTEHSLSYVDRSVFNIHTAYSWSFSWYFSFYFTFLCQLRYVLKGSQTSLYPNKVLWPKHQHLWPQHQHYKNVKNSQINIKW